MKNIYILAVSLLLTITFTSCKKESLQTYLVEKQDKSNFITFDFSTNMLPIKMSENSSSEDQKAFKSVRKINIAFLPNTKASKDELVAEKQKITSILKKTDYKTLMKFSKKGAKGTIYFSGETDAIDEIVGFIYSKEFGVGVARLLGDNMNPNAIIKMMKNLDADGNSDKIKQLKDIIDANVEKVKEE